MNRPLWVAILALVAGVAAFVWSRSVQSVCLATNASGQRIAIGTERTANAIQDHPGVPNDQLLSYLGDTPVEEAWTPASISRCRNRLTLSRATWIAAFSLAAVFAFLARKSSPAVPGPKPGTVFLSYNHEDAAAAKELRAALQASNIPVLVDSEHMAPGERIQTFIERCLQNSEVVVSLVSSRSLLSAWVALETIQALRRNQWIGGRKWIACYLDDAFFDPECRLNLTRQIDDRLRRIEDLLPDYAARRLDSRDLDEEKSRLYDLRNNLGVILDALKSTLCLDLRGPQFDETVKRLRAAIRP